MRVALFADCYHEVNGVALTCRKFEAFARDNSFPMLSIHAGRKTREWTEGSVETLELDRGFFKIPVEADFHFDITFLRHYNRVKRALQRFQPDVIHFTGPGDVGILAVLLGEQLNIPLAGAWHTNLHQFGARRLEEALRSLPDATCSAIASSFERHSLAALCRFYRIPKINFAPNPELLDMMRAKCRNPAFLMLRGADTKTFTPARRRRTDSIFTFGFAGRLSPEKNISQLIEVDRFLRKKNCANYRFLIVGQGSERALLQRELSNVECTGVLQGASLADAYANMDAFLFPSHTDTVGNVILEAFASAVPVVVTASGGPKFLVNHNVDGYVAQTDEEFCEAALRLSSDPEHAVRMGVHARRKALSMSWDSVFQGVYAAYESVLNPSTQSVPCAAA